jgi:hypothetical protein
MRGGGGEGGGAPPHGRERNEMVVIYRYFMLQGSRMKLVCVGEEEKVVGFHLMVERGMRWLSYTGILCCREAGRSWYAWARRRRRWGSTSWSREE